MKIKRIRWDADLLSGMWGAHTFALELGNPLPPDAVLLETRCGEYLYTPGSRYVDFFFASEHANWPEYVSLAAALLGAPVTAFEIVKSQVG